RSSLIHVAPHPMQHRPLVVLSTLDRHVSAQPRSSGRAEPLSRHSAPPPRSAAPDRSRLPRRVAARPPLVTLSRRGDLRTTCRALLKIPPAAPVLRETSAHWRE